MYKVYLYVLLLRNNCKIQTYCFFTKYVFFLQHIVIFHFFLICKLRLETLELSCHDGINTERIIGKLCITLYIVNHCFRKLMIHRDSALLLNYAKYLKICGFSTITISLIALKKYNFLNLFQRLHCSCEI